MGLIKTLDDYIEIVGEPLKVLPYWVEATGKIWTKTSLANGRNRIYVYYGNEDAPDYSDGDTVFDFFDDFEGTSLDSDKWQSSDGNVNNGLLSFPTTSDEIHGAISNFSLTNLNRKVFIEWRGKTGNTEENGESVLWAYHQSTNYFTDTDGDVIFHSFNTGSSPSNWSHSIDISNIGASPDAGVANNLPFNTFKYFRAIVNDKHYEFKRYTDGSFDNLEAEISYDDDTLRSGYLGIRSYSNRNNIVDWIRVRKYTDPEPTVTYGDEETGNWTINGYTYTKRKKVIINSSIELTDYQVALDYNEFQTNSIVITK